MGNKIDFNEEESLDSLKKELDSKMNSTIKKGFISNEEAGNMTPLVVSFLHNMIKGNIKRTLILLIAVESLFFGIVYQSVSLIKFIINLF